MSIQKPMSASDRAYRKKMDDRWKNMTPAQKEASRKMSTPTRFPTKKATPKTKAKVGKAAPAKVGPTGRKLVKKPRKSR